MTAFFEREADKTQPLYVISVAAELSGLHPQTLRQYDRLGLVSPGRSPGRGRRYSAQDIATLREEQRLTAEGVNLAGVKRILQLELQVAALQSRVVELREELGRLQGYVASALTPTSRGAELVPFDPATASLVVWRPER